MADTVASEYINPFVGLRAFEENEDYLFFGRGLQIDELLKRFNDSRFLAVIGSSGSGKSSLVKSGLLPAIYSGFMTVGSNWRVALMQPGENPIGYLTKQLAAEGVLLSDANNAGIPYESVIESRLRRSEKGLMHVYEDAHLPANENLLIVVDQFEELFRFSKYEKDSKFGKSDAMHFIQILLTAAQQKEYPIYVLLTMRSDFLGDCAEFRGLPEAINNGQYLVPRMTRDEIREAITGPVAVSNATISQRLVTRLLNDVNNDTDQLPVLQHAMMRTWDAWYKRNEHNTPIDFEDYDKIGTMQSALSIHADEAYTELKTENEQLICGLIFKALTDKSADLRGVRRPRSVADLSLLTASTETEVCRQVEIFRQPGRTFLMPAHGIALTKDSIIDISHESLMRVWNRLVKWAEDEARSSDIYLRLANAAVLKKRGERGWLVDPELELALRWKEKNKPSAKWSEGFKADFEQAMDYLEKSQKEDLDAKKSREDEARRKMLEEKEAAERKVLEEKEAASRKFLEEKQKAKRKFRGILFTLLVFLLAIAAISLVYLIILSNRAEARKNDAIAQKELALKAKQDAVNQKDLAEKAEKDAIFQKSIADAARTEAEIQKQKAFYLQGIAEENSSKAEVQKQLAEINAANEKKAKDEEQKQRIKVSEQNIKNAPSQYARIIRDGPLSKKKIEKDTFDYKLVAYADHLDSLKRLIGKTNDLGAIKQYDELIEKLYYNNELYEKIYASLVNTTNSKNKVFGNIENYAGSFPGELDSGYNDLKQDKALAEIKITRLIKIEKENLVFCSSEDHWLYIFKKYNNKLVPESKIPMGAKVTALDYNSENHILYFGIESGNIGYMFYHENKKNQPVFENALGSAITAIQFFKRGKRSFLLASAKKSKVVVYALDTIKPEPDTKLIGNILPENNLIEVDNAKFDGKRIVIKVRSTKNGKSIFYYWNPFTKEALDLYRKDKQRADYINKYMQSPTKIY